MSHESATTDPYRDSSYPEESSVDAESRNVVSNYSLIKGKYVPTKTHRFDESLVGLYPDKDALLDRTFVSMDPTGAPTYVIQVGSKKSEGQSTAGLWGFVVEQNGSGKTTITDIPFASRKESEGSCLVIPEGGFVKEVLTDLSFVPPENPDVEWLEGSSGLLSDTQLGEMRYVGSVLDLLGDRVDRPQ